MILINDHYILFICTHQGPIDVRVSSELVFIGEGEGVMAIGWGTRGCCSVSGGLLRYRGSIQEEWLIKSEKVRF